MPANTVVLAFFAEFSTRCLSQVGFILQKLALRDQEKRKNEMKSVQQTDDVNAVKGYWSWKWALGFTFVLMNSATQTLVLPFVDLTLISCNCATAIIVNMVLSTKILGEEFIWQYDLTAMFFIAAGTISIACHAHTEPVSFTGAEIKELLLTLPTVIYLATCVFLVIADRLSLTRMLNKLRKFEEDAEKYDETRTRDGPPSQVLDLQGLMPENAQTSESEVRILPREERTVSGVTDGSANEQALMSKKQRPARVLIALLNDLPEEVVAKVSPESLSLKTYLKVPMLLLLINCAFQSGLCVTFIKLIGEMITANEAKDYLFMTLLLLTALVIASASQIHSLNLAMKHFDQMQVMPIFMVTVMICWMLSGMLILNESKYYSWRELAAMFISFLVCCIGIRIIMTKVKRQRAIEARQRAESLSASCSEVFERQV